MLNWGTKACSRLSADILPGILATCDGKPTVVKSQTVNGVAKRSLGGDMDYIDNKGEKIGSLTVSTSSDKMITINRLRNITTVTVRDRNTGQVSTETFFGDSPFGK